MKKGSTRHHHHQVRAAWRLSEADFYPRMRAAEGWVARRWHAGHAPVPCAPAARAVASGCVSGPAIFADAAMPQVKTDRPIMVRNDSHAFDLWQACGSTALPVSYTHLTLPTILLV